MGSQEDTMGMLDSWFLRQPHAVARNHGFLKDLSFSGISNSLKLNIYDSNVVYKVVFTEPTPSSIIKLCQ